MPELRKGQTGREVRDFQAALMACGYDLPRFGDDGFLGDEVLGAVDDFEDDHNLANSSEKKIIREKTVEWVFEIASNLKTIVVPANFKDLTKTDSGKRKKKRAWNEITGWTLHQTACLLGEKDATWLRVPVQTGVTRKGMILLLNPIEWVTYHGHGFNSHDIGIEIDGRYAGIEGNLKTFWKPQGKDYENWQPDPILDVQVNGVRELMRWGCAVVKAHKGKITYVHAHRQSSDQRTSDPGSALWAAIGLWAQLPEKDGGLGLSDGGPGYKIGSGLAIPGVWAPNDPTRKDIKYL